jgi:uncharacterized protein YacL
VAKLSNKGQWLRVSERKKYAIGKVCMSFLRNPVYLTRLFFVLITTLVGYWVGRAQIPSRGLDYSIIALCLSFILILFELSTDIISSKKILLAAGGLLVGLLIAWFVYPTIPPSVFGSDIELGQLQARIICNLVFGYLGIILAIKHANRLSFSRLNFILASPSESAKILDTSVIVDGRIVDLIKSNFLPGNFLVPEFVLEELHKLADSSDEKKRARGRRGLEMLEAIKNATPRLAICEKDYPEHHGVDGKLIALTRELGGELVTNDYNLQKIAEFYRLRVLNINELANILKPSVYVGETLSILIAREGKEPNQGIGYLEDGTMVVVEDGRSHIGSKIETVVTSIHQTTAGRMIFARPSDHTPTPIDLQRVKASDLGIRRRNVPVDSNAEVSVESESSAK